ncbi:fibronectin type III domain-containing protein [Microbacterium trichothecenolyticum]|uniref:galactosylceramidase n=1 Tax=Microbacterium trichothecenolyticum TaxID=69370 RepID=A0A0M2H8W4_MICTR|nr:family 16 glycoside hydrolase [Microbacterium trichothecenolyticum]KJL40584.1 Glycosyl hydrolase family 59 [Microbacterium trichothecenolyticum]
MRTTLVAVVTAAVVAAPLAVPTMAQAAGADPVTVNVTGADIAAAAQNRNGLTFKGFGVLSANSTSALLLDYKSQHPDAYWELIETLFGGDHPIMNTVKIEMGNDRNTSTGPNASTMRTRDEYPNVLREPGFQLAADAQLVAHGDVHVSLLRWNRPAWVANDADQYIWFKNTVLAAYREFGVMIDSINPDTNETSSPNIQLYKNFSGWVRGDEKGYEGATASDPNNGFASEEEKSLYRAIQTIAADTVGTPPVSFGNAMTSATDSSLRDAVDVVGFHYSSADDSAGNMKKIAEQLDKEVWNSEGQSTFSSSADRPNNNASDEQGGFGTQFGGTNSALEMGNWVTTGFNASRRTMNIFQPAIGSFYDGFQYSSKELVNARDPWSGWMYYDGGLAVIEHFTQFAKLGWENADNTAGIWRAIPKASGSELGTGNPPSGARAGGASYTTLAAPDASDFSTVIINDSKFTKTYRIVAKDLNLGADQTGEVWETRAADAGQAYDANYLKPVGEVTPAADGTYSVTVKPWSAVTFTTLDHATVGAAGKLAAKDGYGSALPSSKEYTDADGGRDVLDTDASGNVNGVTDDAVLYADDFDYAEQGNIKDYDPASGELSDGTVSYLDSRGNQTKPAGTPAVQSEDNGATPRYTNDTNGAFESVATPDTAHHRVLRQQVGPGMAGGAWNGGDPKTTIGDARWANYTVSSDVLFEASGSQYATIGAREQGGTANGQSVSAAELKIDPTGAWTFMRFGATLSTGTVAGNAAAAFKTGAGVWNNIAVKVAGSVYTAYVNGMEVAAYTDAAPQATGRIQLGSSFNFVQFDNLKIETVPGYTPYYAAMIDGMHQTSWADRSVPVLQFDKNWSHANGQGMFEWQRTASKSTAKGASMTYSFTGTGMDIIGTNAGTTTLDVIVDGVQVATAAPTFAAGSERTTFILRGLSSGPHTVVIKTANDASINVDAVGVVTATADSAKADTTALAAVADAVKGLDEGEYSAETWAVFAAVKANATAALDDPAAYGLDTEGSVAIAARLTAAADGLVPKDVSADVLDLGVVTITSTDRALPTKLDLAGTNAKVTWSLASTTSAKSVAELGTFVAAGRSTEKLSSGVYQRFGATVLVVPADLDYFIDSGATGAPAGSVYAAVKASAPGLLNDTSDQKWDGTTAGTTWGYSTTATTIAAGTPAEWGSSYVGADYNKPITYHLTLPAGSYNIVAVQAPRAGLTTNVYSKVKAAGTETTKNATSTGSATPVTQALTLDADAVVDVEFGTNGTSGYNARLALVYVQSLPRDVGVQGALTVDEDLPETVTVAGSEKAVEWDAASAAQPRTVYRKLTVTGRLTDTDQAVIAGYEIIPPALVYYIDSGTSGAASPQYTAVAGSVSLRNDRVDQVSTAADQWGYIADGMKTKGTTDINDKYSTGLYQDTTKLVYRLPLDAGTYTLTAGFTEWWNLNRAMYQTVSVGGTELAKGTVPLSGSSTPIAAPLTFTLTAPATVDYLVTNEGAGAEKPVISWLAVADETLPGAPQNVTAALAGDTSITVAWDASAVTGPGFTGYRVYEAGGADPVCETSSTSCTVRALELGTTHSYEVAGVNALGEGERSAATASVTLPEVASNDGAKTVPAKGVLSSNDGWDTGLKDGTFQLTMNLWWGENGSLFKLYRDGELVAKVPLTMMTPGAQSAVVDITGLVNGTYVFTGELVNSKGTTATQPLTVKVTDASPGKPVLSSDARGGTGSYTVTADLWWGTNATSYRFLENGVEVGAGDLKAATPGAQRATLPVSGKAKGTYTYTVEFTNAAGTTASAPLKVTVTK